MSQLLLNSTTTPATPTSGKLILYTKSDGYLYYITSTGVEERVVDFGDVAQVESVLNMQKLYFSGL